MDIVLNQDWKQFIHSIDNEEVLYNILRKISHERSLGKKIYPNENNLFTAFNICALSHTKIVILGQDPYHNPNQANGLSFSVPKNTKVPPSLKNIFKEMHSDVGVSIPHHGDLTYLAEQGILFINAILTVEENKPGSHKKIGWLEFTDNIIKGISDTQNHIVFMLWGNFAKTKAELINREKHLILEAAHPSPLARGAFFGSKHFSKANEYLQKNKKEEIDWNIPNDELLLFQ